MFLFVFLFIGCTKPISVSKEPIKKVALVIGNQDYMGNNDLKNPINDAEGMKETLESIGFETMLVLDVTLAQLNESLETLKSKIEANKTIVFIYFAGHGNTLQKNSSEQFLMMTDKKQRTIVSIFKFYDFLKKVQARHSIIVLDACRDYQKHYTPINGAKNEENFRGNIRYDNGLKKDVKVFVEKNNYEDSLPRSTIVSYATQRNQKAKDFSRHNRKHSPYSYALMKYLDDEEIPIEEVFRRVRVSILEETNGEQSSSEEMKLEKNIWLVPKKAKIAFSPPI
ncbi:MAG: Unknown protein [uncultured Sulfurovum sp.]|uniref:Caspase family p20 domain-containing protein n=1 Tax=uncultured Sulfurovum sp. TaxID=269237 RepID=A0A6S6SAU6_9BACT|nr:MAG: Unknown protein [uncultured Sulfurovum sp.]